MDKYLIFDEESGQYLTDLELHQGNSYVTQRHCWSVDPSLALTFELEEAESVINFINDVIDWELAQLLTVVRLGDIIGVSQSY